MAKDRVGILVPPPLYPLLGLGAALLLEWQVPLPAVPLAARVAGVVLAALAIALAFWAVAAFVRGKTPVDPYSSTKRIVTDGPYRWTRNPIYLAFAVATLGIGLAAGWWWALPMAPVVLLVLQVVVVRREEAYLEAKFGAEYAAYRSRVRRWF